MLSAVGLVADRDHFGAELVEHRRRDVVARAMRAIDDDLQALEVEIVRKRALAEFDVAARRVADAERLAQLRRLDAADRTVDALLDRLLDRVRQLGAACREELDAVVLERIVRGADHDAGRQAQRARQVGDAGRGQRTGQIDVDAGGGQPRFERRLEQVAGDARVLPDQHRRVRARARRRFGREHAAGGVTEPQHELGRDRRVADSAADAIGAEIVLGHGRTLIRR